MGALWSHIPSNAAERIVRFLRVIGPIEAGVNSMDCFCEYSLSMLSIDEGYYFFSFFFCKFFSELFAVSLVKSCRPGGKVGECPPSEYDSGP